MCVEADAKQSKKLGSQMFSEPKMEQGPKSLEVTLL